MTPETQRIAIAQAMGYTDICEASFYGGRIKDLVGTNSRGEKETLPPYLNDLNAMFYAEEMLGDKAGMYGAVLMDLVIDEPDPTFPKVTPRIFSWHATAAQRAKAFLKTLNLWKEQS